MAETVFDRSHVNPALVASALSASDLQPFWLDGLDIPEWPAFTGREVFDLVVVGGGYTGLWTALLAKQRDPSARVAVLEGRTVGWAASGRNGGFVEASLTHGDDNGRSRFPSEIERLIELGLEKHHPRIRMAALGEDGGPQAGVASADDRQVGDDGRVEAVSARLGDVVDPERTVRVDGRERSNTVCAIPQYDVTIRIRAVRPRRR